jgi:hypothetical protein
MFKNDIEKAQIEVDEARNKYQADRSASYHMGNFACMGLLGLTLPGIELLASKLAGTSISVLECIRYTIAQGIHQISQYVTFIGLLGAAPAAGCFKLN